VPSLMPVSPSAAISVIALCPIIRKLRGEAAADQAMERILNTRGFLAIPRDRAARLQIMQPSEMLASPFADTLRS